MTNEEIRELIQLAKDTAVTELEIQRGDNRVRIRLGSTVEQTVTVPVSAPVAAAPALRAESPAAKAPEASIVYAKSPIIGTFYERPSPEEPPFVQVGDRVSPGTILCIIESMKLMNPIEADVAGVIESRLKENGKSVEYGEALFGIRPL